MVSFREGGDLILDSRTLESYKRLFHSAHNMDHLQIKSNLDLFHGHYDPDEEIEVLRNILKQCLLEEICKVDLNEDDRDFFAKCTKEVEDCLEKHSDTRNSGYLCCIIGCRFVGSRHRYYVRHVKRDHPNIKSVLCNFKKSCKRNFSSISGLMNHIKEVHSSSSTGRPFELPPAINSPSPVETPCKCDRESCGGIHLRNISDLLRHYNSAHANEDRPCVFENCSTLFRARVPRYAMNHIRVKHKNMGNMKLKSKYILNPGPDESIALIRNQSFETISAMHQADIDYDGDMYQEDDFEDIEASDNNLQDVCIDENGNQYYLEYFSDFLSRLAFVKFVPQTVIQEICEEFISNTRKSLLRQEKVLRKSLETCDSCDVERIVEDLFKNDPFLTAQEHLNTEYKRKLFVQSCPTYVEPKEILLNPTKVREGGKKEVYHYVPLVASLNVLTVDPTFIKMRAGAKVFNDHKLRDLKDGSLFKNSNYFNENKDAFSIILYSDAVELQNPLGAARGTYKLVFIYYTLCEVVKPQRSQIDHLQLVMTFKEKLLKKYSLAKILKPLIDDLKSLEHGIEMSSPTRILKCGVACYVSDNLEASLVGGFSSNFSSYDVCRICHMQHKDLLNHAHESHGDWTVDEYDIICDAMFQHDEEDPNSDNIEIDGDHLFPESTSESEGSDNEIDPDGEEETSSATDVQSRGLRSRCTLNVLQSFHSVTGFPLDIMHDLFEGKKGPSS